MTNQAHDGEQVVTDNSGMEGEVTSALRKLAAEVEALRPFEGELRAELGNTNWNVLMLRLREAHEALAAPPSPAGDPVTPPDFTQDAINRVARRLAYDEFQNSSGPDRKAFAASRWRDYLPRAVNALQAAFLTKESVMTAWEWAAIMSDEK